MVSYILTFKFLDSRREDRRKHKHKTQDHLLIWQAVCTVNTGLYKVKHSVSHYTLQQFHVVLG
jgi:hypothetical protein